MKKSVREGRTAIGLRILTSSPLVVAAALFGMASVASATPVITTQPVGQTIFVGQSATFSVSATGGSPLTYQWQVCSLIPGGCTDIAGATASIYTTPPATQATSGISNVYYQVTVMDPTGAVTSTQAYLYVDPAGGVAITQQPADQTVAVGQTATFTVVAASTSPLSYVWVVNRYPEASDAHPIPGATGSSYTTPPTVSTDTGNYYAVRVINSVDSRYSRFALLTVSTSTIIPPPPPPTSACDLNGDGQVNILDVQREVNMVLQVIPCTNACTVASVQRIVNASLGGTCVAP
jgi:hypothetical protein